ncbi:hypothetical protein FRC01_003389 [Tulasnella sp. 417]|nr:hypothetical protein FRC01_003389 [Tulasnella sp. 417]
MPLNLAAEMIAESPKALKGWCGKIKVAVKMLRWIRNDVEELAKRFKSFANELSIMAELSHPNVIEFIGFVEDVEKGDAWIILPWEAKGNVREFLQSGEWDLPERISLIQDTARGLEYLHSHQPPICHGDLKSLNILVNSCYQAVITDFGSARIKQHAASAERENPSVTPQGAPINGCRATELTSPEVKLDPSTFDLTLTGPAWSLRWTAPEVMGGQDQDLPSDMWALGWISWEIITGKIPFDELERQEAIIHHTVMGTLPAIRENSDLSHVLMLCSLMSECWLLEPAQRIHASAFQRKVGLIRSGDAKVACMEACEFFSQTGQHARHADSLQHLGDIHVNEGMYVEAEEPYRHAQAIFSNVEDAPGEAGVLVRLGVLYVHRDRHDQAEKCFAQARAAYAMAADADGKAMALEGLMQVYVRQGKFADAKVACMEACEILSRTSQHSRHADNLKHLGEIHMNQGTYVEAEESYRHAQSIFSSLEDPPGEAGVLFRLGVFYVRQDRRDQAEQCFAQARVAYAMVSDEDGEAQALDWLAAVKVLKGKFDDAKAACMEAGEIFKMSRW